MSFDKKEQLLQKKKKIALGGGPERIKKQHAKGKKQAQVHHLSHHTGPNDVMTVKDFSSAHLRLQIS